MAINAQKGGLKGGSKNSVQQKKARQKVGKKYGKKTGTNNASKNLKKMLSKNITWIYHEKKNQEVTMLIIKPQKSFAQVISILNKYGKQKIKNPASF